MRDTVAGWSAAREQLAIRQSVIDELRAAVSEQAKNTRAELDALRSEIAAERARLKRLARAGKLQGMALGIIVGVALAAVR